MAVFDDCIDEKLKLYPHKIEWKQRIPIANKAQAEVIEFEQKEPLKAECEHFLRCIEQRISPRTDVIEGLNVLRILTASQLSLNSSGADKVSVRISFSKLRNFFSLNGLQFICWAKTSPLRSQTELALGFFSKALDRR